MHHVCYDITFQGLAHGGCWPQTGIYWASHRFLQAMIEHVPHQLKWHWAVHRRLAAFGRNYLHDHRLPGQTEVSVYGSPWLPVQQGRSPEWSRKLLPVWWWDQCRSTMPRLPEKTLYHSLFLPLPRPARNRARSLPRVLTLHDVLPLIRPEWSSRVGVYRTQKTVASIRPDDCIICPSMSAKADACQAVGLNPDHVVVIPWGVDDPAIFADEPVGPLPPAVTKPYLLYVGAIEPRKNIRHLLDCFSAWVSQEGFDDVSLVLVSPPGPMKQALQEYARTHPVLARQVCWLGQQPSPVLGQLLRQAMMLVHPSLYEGFGLTVLEAMARGTPVVASSTTACGEVADEAAWLVDPTDAEALCQAMHAIATDVGHQQRLGKLGRLRAQQFSWETTVRQTLKVYQSL
ncbi:MAG: glycosyltransferase family 4 protein [Cyanobacteria bacterium HKST-UBA06]|nr:glycosyltransferase family 4 protein [Cyanobacteria bacterium HKST-UBA06]